MSDDSSRPISTPFTGWRLALLAVVAVAGLFVGAQVIGSLLVYLLPLLNHWTSVRASYWLEHSVAAQLAYGVIADGVLVAGVFGMMKFLGWNLADIGLKWPRWWHPLVGIVAAVPYYILYLGFVIVLSNLLPGLDIDQKQEIGFGGAQGTLELSMAFLGLVILPALAEEITMRGFLYSGLRRWLPKIAAALAVSALFGAAHLSEGGAAGPLWIGALDTFTLSLVLVFLREKTGNLWSGIVLHATKNGVAFVSLFFFHLR